MKAILLCVAAMLWFISYRFVIRKATDTLRELNYPVGSLDDYASAEKKMMLFIVSPAIAIYYLLGELKCAILSIYVKRMKKEE